MKGAILYLILAIGIVSCNGNKELRKEKSSVLASNAVDNSAKTAREEFWPLENEVTRFDTTIQSGDSYKIQVETRSLNDSAAIHRATDEQGEIIIHAHNQISEVTILKNGQPFLKARLTRELFKGRDELDELTITHNTSFIKLKNDNFIFLLEACVPDSDVCDAAEVAINSKSQVRVVKYLEELQE